MSFLLTVVGVAIGLVVILSLSDDVARTLVWGILFTFVLVIVFGSGD